ncbi:MAG: hypothetical protein KY469_15700 [Actinobacteria bacterium]|nr:hypothetical protein [Actinomycetota bacterium]
MKRTTIAAAAAAVVALLTACGGGDEASTSGMAAPSNGVAPPAAGACLEGTIDCVDTVVDPSDMGDAFDDEVARSQAEAMLGVPEADLPADGVRIGRKGQETYALTEDYVLGRMTVELDQDDTGTWVVTKVVVELLAGPETFTG